MKKLLLLGAAAAMTLGFASAASADTSETGTINLTGTVPAQCSVITGGAGAGGGTFGDTVNLNVGGTIADANGHLLPALNTSTAANAPANKTYQINCTGAANAISLKATPLANLATAATGYANTVNYTAEADFAVVGGTSPVSLTQTSNGTTNTSAFSAGVRLANAPSNITVKAYTFNTTNTATDILVAGAYAGTITVTVAAGT